MKRVLIRVLATLVLIIVEAVATLGITYWVMARRFVVGDAHARDGVVLVPVNEPLVFLKVTVCFHPRALLQWHRHVKRSGVHGGRWCAGSRRRSRHSQPRDACGVEWSDCNSGDRLVAACGGAAERRSV